MTSPEDLQEIKLHEIKPDTVIRIHTDYGQVIETPVKRKKLGWDTDLIVYPSNEPGTPSIVIQDSCKVYLVREDIEEPEHPGSVVTVKYPGSDKEYTLVKVHDDGWYTSGAPWQVYQSWSEILERCYDIKVVHEGYNPDHEWVKIPESWDDLEDVPKFINYLVDRDGDPLRRDPEHPNRWQWWHRVFKAWIPNEFVHYSPFTIDPDHPLTSEGQE